MIRMMGNYDNNDGEMIRMMGNYDNNAENT